MCSWDILLVKGVAIHGLPQRMSSLFYTVMGFTSSVLASAGVRLQKPIPDSCCMFIGSRRLLTSHVLQPHFESLKTFTSYPSSQNFLAMSFTALSPVVQIIPA